LQGSENVRICPIYFAIILNGSLLENIHEGGIGIRLRSVNENGWATFGESQIGKVTLGEEVAGWGQAGF
jgi:hypothetical protein